MKAIPELNTLRVRLSELERVLAITILERGVVELSILGRRRSQSLALPVVVS